MSKLYDLENLLVWLKSELSNREHVTVNIVLHTTSREYNGVVIEDHTGWKTVAITYFDHELLQKGK